MHVFQAVLLRALNDPLGFLLEVGSAAARRVIHHEGPEIVVRDVAGDFVDEFAVRFLGQKRALLR
jgi:hypothetical protein